MRASNQYKASVTLAASMLIFLASLPFTGNFWAGLAASMAGAAMIGGLADWFAVSALFRRPLGIPFRTALIPRNREKIFSALTGMIERDLLTRQNIAGVLERYDVSGLLVRYLTDHGGRANLAGLAVRLLSDMLENTVPRDVGRTIAQLLRRGLERVTPGPLLADLVEWLLRTGIYLQIMAWLVSELRRISRLPEFRRAAADSVARALNKYRQGAPQRQVLQWVVDYLAGWPPERVADLMISEGLAVLEAYVKPGGPAVAVIEKNLVLVAQRLRSDQDLALRLRQAQLELLASLPLSSWLTAMAGQLQEEWRNRPDAQARLTVFIDNRIGEGIDIFSKNSEQQAALDLAVKGVLNGWLDGNIHAFGVIVTEHLSRFSDAMLVEFIEARVGEDLQMIRINGSVVGSVVGMAIFLLNRLW